MIGRPNSALPFLRPAEQSSTIEWLREHARNTDGRPYSHESYPHLGAPGGPADAMDDPNVRKIWLQFASRLGKTFFGQCCAMKKADCNPGPMMFASSVEKTASEVIERTYQMIERSPRVDYQLRPKARRRQSVIDFDACQMHVAWARSVSTLSDKEVEFGHANEIDKWEHLKTSKEADPLRLFSDRLKNRPHHKAVLESTPTVKGKSRIETGRLGSTNCQLHVPCPHCGRYQVLSMGNLDEPRLKWEHLANGRSDKDIARRTGYYVCEHCEGRIEDHHRPQMMRLGVWCPEGCTVIDDEARRVAEQYNRLDYGAKGTDGESTGHEWRGWKYATWISGTPLRDGSEAGYQLSSLYALSLTWGDIAAEFVSCKDKPQDLRNFINQWLAETWEQIVRQSTWENLGSRIIKKEVIRGKIPSWASMLTAGVDRQSAGGERFPWVLDAWGPGEKCATIAYGEEESFAALYNNLIAVEWPHEDGGPPLAIAFTLIDSGYKPDGVYEFCLQCHQSSINVWPCKGSTTALPSDYRVNILGNDTSCPGMRLVNVDSIRSQLWIEKQIENPDGVYSLYWATLLDHQDFLEQLLNDGAVDALDRTNNVRQNWERLDTNTPNDYRDGRRYSRTAMLIACHGRGIPERVAAPAPTVIHNEETIETSGVTRHRW